MAQQMIVDAVAAKVGLSLATLSYATRVVAGEAYQARLDGFFGVRYEVRALHHVKVCSSAIRRPTGLALDGGWLPCRPLPQVPH